MKPFNNLGMTTLSIRNTGGTDHQSFDAVGLPGFQFVQDPVEYGTRTHHSNMDLYERIQEEDMRKNAVIVASFVYLTANRDLPLPRKPLPAPQPAGAGRGTGSGTGAVRHGSPRRAAARRSIGFRSCSDLSSETCTLAEACATARLSADGGM